MSLISEVVYYLLLITGLKSDLLSDNTQQTNGSDAALGGLVSSLFLFIYLFLSGPESGEVVRSD